MKATLSAKERKELFKIRAKASAGGLLFSMLIFLVGIGFVGLGIDSAVEGSWGAVALCLFYGPVLVIVGVWWLFLGSVSTAKVQAVKQCLAVAEKFGIALTTWQARALESNFNSGSVFTAFVEEIEKTKPDLILPGTFHGSGGRNEETCRLLIERLWSSDSPREAAEEAEKAEAGSKAPA